MYRLAVHSRDHPWLADLALIAMLLVVSPVWLRSGYWPAWVRMVSYALLLLPLLGRRRYPVAVAGSVLAVAWLQYAAGVWGANLPIGMLALLVALYHLVATGHHRAAVAMTAGTVAFLVTWALTRYPPASAPWGAAGAPLLVALAWLAGAFVAARRAHLTEVALRSAAAAAERQALARAAVAEERARIAQDLHDVLAHSLSVIVVNAEGAQLVRDADPPAVDRTLATIADTGRAALVELRHVLAALPAPGSLAEELRRLVARARSGGRPIELSIAGTDLGLPDEAALHAQRIVQETVTNMIKHGVPGAPAGLTVDLGTPGPGRRVRIEATNAAGGVGGSGRGRGLAGIRARAERFGGTVTAGPTTDGRYRLVATLLPDAPVVRR